MWAWIVCSRKYFLLGKYGHKALSSTPFYIVLDVILKKIKKKTEKVEKTLVEIYLYNSDDDNVITIVLQSDKVLLIVVIYSQRTRMFQRDYKV